jgi:hypothetical protein
MKSGGSSRLGPATGMAPSPRRPSWTQASPPLRRLTCCGSPCPTRHSACSFRTVGPDASRLCVPLHIQEVGTAGALSNTRGARAETATVNGFRRRRAIWTRRWPHASRFVVLSAVCVSLNRAAWLLLPGGSPCSCLVLRKQVVPFRRPTRELLFHGFGPRLAADSHAVGSHHWRTSVEHPAREEHLDQPTFTPGRKPAVALEPSPYRVLVLPQPLSAIDVGACPRPGRQLTSHAPDQPAV